MKDLQNTGENLDHLDPLAQNPVLTSSEPFEKRTTIDAEEIAHFSRLAEQWWDSEGKFRPLHKFNPVRIGYIKEKICEIFARDVLADKPFKGLSLLDIGCGGGLLAEPMARLGASVTGADAAEKNINSAKIHAQENGLDIDYQVKTAEILAQEGRQFDIILNMEVVEHVHDVPLFMKSCCQMLKPGGVMFIATINRHWKALVLAIIGAEYILNWLPKGTHHYDKFLKPLEIEKYLIENGVTLIDQTGVQYNPLEDRWKRSKDMDVNYMLLARRF